MCLTAQICGRATIEGVGRHFTLSACTSGFSGMGEECKKECKSNTKSISSMSLVLFNCKSYYIKCKIDIDTATVTYWAVSHVSGSVIFHAYDFIVSWKQQIVPICSLGCTLFVILLRRETFNIFSLWKELEDCCQTLFKRDWRAEILKISAIEELAVGLIQQ